jgi:hypothetical protein
MAPKKVEKVKREDGAATRAARAAATEEAVGGGAAGELMTLGHPYGLPYGPFEEDPPLDERGSLIAEGVLRSRPGEGMGGPRWRRQCREDGLGHLYVEVDMGMSVTTGPSSIAGTGVFAMECLTAGLRFGLDGLEVLRRGTAKEEAEEASEGREYTVMVRDPYYYFWIVHELVRVAETVPGAYANSPIGTADPTGNMRLRTLGGRPTLGRARDVSLGEELTWDYGSEHRLKVREECVAAWRAACEERFALHADVQGGTQSSGELYSPTRD